MCESKGRPIILASDACRYTSGILLHSITRVRQRRLVSKIEAKFCAFRPAVKIEGAMGEKSGWILPVRPTIGALGHFWRACLGHLGHYRVWVS